MGIGCSCALSSLHESKLGSDDLAAEAVTEIDSSRGRGSVRETGLGANGCVSLSTAESFQNLGATPACALPKSLSTFTR